MKKYIDKYSIGFLAMFTMIILSSSFLLSIYNTSKQDMKIDNYLLSNDAETILISNTSLIKKDLLNVIFSQNNIIFKGMNVIEDNNQKKGTIMYFNYDLDMYYPMIEGEFFSKEDCINNEQVAIVGKNIVDDVTYNIDNKRYIKVENREYIVKGIMGDKNRNLKCNDMFILNASSYYNNTNNMKSVYTYILSSKNDTDKIVKNIINQLKSLDSNIVVSNTANVQFQGQTVLFAEYELPKIFKSVIFVFLINVLIVNVFWLISRQKELAIKKMLGATNVDIAITIIIYQQVLILLAYILAIVLHLMIVIIYSHTILINYIGTQVDILGTVSILFVLMLIGLFIDIPIINKVNSINPIMGMKR
ncbi:MAG: ABC transporter permease [Clostridia bacterium]|nr:ABC transporter permease [Clostridia bacterium]